MLHRTLIPQGKGGYTISLPVAWVRERRLKPGDPVTLELTDQGIHVSADAPALPLVVRLSFEQEAEPFIRFALSNAYRNGFTHVEAHFRTGRQERTIEQVTRDLLPGFEITERHQGHLVLSLVAEPSVKEEGILSRMLYMMRDSLRELESAMQSGQRKKISHIRGLHLDLDRSSNMLRRHLFLNRLQSRQGFYYWAICHELSVVQHSVSRAYAHLSPPSSRAQRIFADVKERVLAIQDAFLRKNMVAIEKAQDPANRFRYDQLFPAIRKGEDSLIILAAIEILRSSYLMISPMLGILLIP